MMTGRLRTHTLNVTRPVGSYVDSVWVDEAPILFDIECSVQPATFKDLQSVEEGRRSERAWRVYTDTEIRTAKENEYEPDRVIIDGDDCEFVAVQRWSNGILPHYKGLAMKVQPA